MLLALGPATVTSTDSPPCASVPVLMYHKVVNWGAPSALRVAPAVFEAQISHLKRNGYHTITLGNWVDHITKGRPLPDRPVIITFDDGYLDNYQNALPILRKAGYVATVFITAGRLGKTLRWENEQGQPTARVMTPGQVQALQAAGWEIGSHTLTHPKLTEISWATQQKELLTSRQVLERITGRPVRSFAYPNGAVNDSVAAAVRASGYQAAVTTTPGNNSCLTDFYHLHRWRVSGTEPLTTFFQRFP